jgi:molybdopterin converting factor small subunit
MQVTVKYFGVAATRTGVREEVWHLKKDASLAELKALLEQQYELGSKTGVYFNLNGKGIAEAMMTQCRLTAGDMIMVIPQISGG